MVFHIGQCESQVTENNRFSHFIHPQTEMGEKEQKLEILQSKVSELKKFSQSQETPAKLQVINMILILCVFIFSE